MAQVQVWHPMRVRNVASPTGAYHGSVIITGALSWAAPGTDTITKGHWPLQQAPRSPAPSSRVSHGFRLLAGGSLSFMACL